jgi:hypothetical protein
MRCLECGHSNPESNKFCGECGAKLQSRAATMEQAAQAANVEDIEDKDTARERVRDSGAHVSRGEQTILSSVIVQKEFPPATPEEEAEEEKASLEADTMAAQRRTRVAGIGGPSILGLGYETSADPAGFVYDRPRRDGFVYDTDGSTPEYLLDDMPGRTVSWRAWALLAVLVIAGGFGYLQWRANRGQGPNLLSMARGYISKTSSNSSAANDSTAATNPTPSAANNSTNTPAPNATNSPQTASQTAGQANPTSSTAIQPDAQTSEQQSSATLSSDSEDNQPNDTSNNQPAASSDKTDIAKTPADKTATDTNAADKNAADKNAAAGNSQSVGEDNSASASTQPDEVENPESDQPAKRTIKSASQKSASAQAEAVEASKPKPLGDKDPLIVQAENYIQGRGRPKNCSAAVNLLRQSVSQGNPAADVKHGAL